jgi:hypothetical protein
MTLPKSVKRFSQQTVTTSRTNWLLFAEQLYCVYRTAEKQLHVKFKGNLVCKSFKFVLCDIFYR